MIALELVFTPIINRNLKEFFNQWNNYPLLSEHNQSPLQLFSHFSNPCGNENVNGLYGVDQNGPIPELQTSNHVVVPELDIQIDNDFATQDLNVLADDGSHGIDTYLDVRNRIREIFH